MSFEKLFLWLCIFCFMWWWVFGAKEEEPAPTMKPRVKLKERRMNTPTRHPPALPAPPPLPVPLLVEEAIECPPVVDHVGDTQWKK